MPHDSAAEESVVGSMLFDKEAIDLAGELLLKEDFYEKQYGIVFEAMVELNNAGKSVDMVTLQSYLKEKDVPDEIASLEFLQGIMQLYITSSNVKQYAEIVKKHSLLRRLIRVSDEISNDCYSQNKSLNVIFEDTEKKIFDIVQRKNTGDFTPINKIVETSIKRLQTIMMSGSRITGISTGFTDLDNTLSGLQPSDLILIAARPSMGKTAFALNIAQFAAVREKNCTAVFSLEMSKEQLVNRLLAMDATVDAQKLRNADLDDNEIEYIMESAVNLGSSKLIIDDTSGISV
ncbi:MAG TPA: replicative DNA helicase, partial [Lachnospiraceae bacterium]|nr:replicative DNA helicase [Lachnospiraceae bacterium]